ncbi:hypothetical protein RKD26_004224 [Streptomyces calvus]
MVFPTPYPQGYGGTPPLPRSRTCRLAGSPEHARGSARHAMVAALYRRFARDSRRRESDPHRGVRPAPAALAARSRVEFREPRHRRRPAAGPGAAPAGAHGRGAPGPACDPVRRAGAEPLRGRRRHAGHPGATPLPARRRRDSRHAADGLPGTPAGGLPARRRRTCGTMAGIHRSVDRFPCPRPNLFSQLPVPVHPGSHPPLNPRSTCTERAWGALRTLRGLATATRRTSLHAPRVQPFVIECFTPSCQVDNVPGAELATGARRDTVDSILTVLRRGTRAGPRGNVQERHNRGAATTEGGLAV